MRGLGTEGIAIAYLPLLFLALFGWFLAAVLFIRTICLSLVVNQQIRALDKETEQKRERLRGMHKSQATKRRSRPPPASGPS